MQQYLDLLRKVKEEGVFREDRTGTGTYSLFGAQLRFDLSKGFPLVTTKKVHFKSVVHELLWFLKGDTNVKYLNDNGVTIWNEWIDSEGNLGPTYGKQMRCIDYITPISPKYFEPPFQVKNKELVFGVGYYGNCNKKDKYYNLLVNTWREMLRRCYHEKSNSYKSYGFKGVHVDKSWHCFENFQKEVKNIPGWNLKLEYPEEYSLDKDILWRSNKYSKETCMWASHEEQSANTSTNKYFEATNPQGEVKYFDSIGSICREFFMNLSAVHRCLHGKLKTHHKWKNFKYLNPKEGEVFIWRKIDQLKNVIASIKHNPDSRRHIISLWNAHDIDRMKLPPCHGNIIQFYVANGKLSCSMYQRSCDIFLGIPMNIASYALLTHMVAQVCGLKVGDFVHTFGDIHLYSNHLEQAEEQLKREPLPLPWICLNADIKNIFEFKYDDIILFDYNSHPSIKAPVAV